MGIRAKVPGNLDRDEAQRVDGITFSPKCPLATIEDVQENAMRQLSVSSRAWPSILLPLFPLLVASQDLDSIPSPLICRDTLNGDPPFRHNDIPCLLRCYDPVSVPTGDLLPGMINATAIPYCQLDCVHHDATPEQSARAPDCNAGCETSNAMGPENMGWCMFWCVDGFSDIVHSTTCVPSLVYGDPTPTEIQPGFTVTRQMFTQPPEYVAWLETQTILSDQTIQTVAPQTSFTGNDQESTSSSGSSATSATSAVDVSTPSKTATSTSSIAPESTTTISSTEAEGQGQQGAVESDDDESQAILSVEAFAWPGLLTGVALVASMLL
ncbi:hypothetical protein B0T11DRAFT_319783 [Plectosphaerella cucumerina]|uniref:Uncharacterized protein n=1 Tax=Plectosphaerella cucumerina TaxID=40658 RepID=A0A8K0X211_9PEZI|nr:hypothetical protein B0T11DRAFT_319783 [Plectosphaerella cucumerina]